MNILFYCDEYPPYGSGGIGSTTRVVAEELVRRGHSVYVVGYYPYDVVAEECVELNGVHIYRYNLGYRITKLRHGFTYLLRQVGLSRTIIQREINFVEHKIERIIAGKSIDIVEFPDFMQFNIHAKGLKYRRFGVATLLRLHGSASFVFERGGRAKSYISENDRSHFDRCDSVSAVSRYAMDYMKEHFYDVSFRRKEVIYNGVESEFINKSNPQSDDVILFVGKLIRDKGCYSLLRAFNICAAQNSSLRLRLLGGGDQQKAMRLIDPAFRGRVEFLGAMDREGVKAAIDSASFICIPSYYESFSMAALEVMARQRALIYTSQSSGAELIVDGENGLLVDPDNIEQIAQKIVLLTQDHALRDRVAMAGHNTIIERFCIEKIVDELEQFYRSCIYSF